MRENGIDGWDGFYLSCDCGARKSNGKLYELILREQGVVAEQVLHIGDNDRVDVAIPMSMGIRAYHYGKVVDNVMSANPFLQRFLTSDNSAVARRLVAAVCIAWHNYVAVNPRCPYWAKVGGMLGGVLCAAYVRFLVRSARENKIHRLLFVARDGYVLEKVCNLVAPDINTTYIYAPRMVKNSRDSHVLTEYEHYVRALRMSNEESIAVVDSVSMQFSAQKLISRVLGKKVFSISFIALEKPEFGDCFLFAPNMSLRWCHLVEQFFMAKEPPIEAVVNGQPVYKTQLSIEEQKRIKVFSELVDPEIQVAGYLLLKQIDISPVCVLDYIDAFLDSMTMIDEEQFSSLKNGVDICSEDYRPILSPPHWVNIWRTFKRLPVYRRHYGREGLKMVTRDYLFGLFQFRVIEEDL